MMFVVEMFVMRVLGVVCMVFSWLQATSTILRLPFGNLAKTFRNAEMDGEGELVSWNAHTSVKYTGSHLKRWRRNI